MDLALLNHATLEAWGESLQVSVGGVVRDIRGVYSPGYAPAPLDAGEQRPDPSFEFKLADWQRVNGQAGATITRVGVVYTVIGDAERIAGDWCVVKVRAYGG